MSESSAVSPELDSASTASSAVIIPRSPWLASPGWTNWAGVPVEAKVAAILRATWPLLPIPVTMTRPRIAASSSTPAAKRPSRPAINAVNPSISMPRTRRATAMLALSVTASRGMVASFGMNPGVVAEGGADPRRYGGRAESEAPWAPPMSTNPSGITRNGEPVFNARKCPPRANPRGRAGRGSEGIRRTPSPSRCVPRAPA